MHACCFVTAPLHEPSLEVIRGLMKLRDTPREAVSSTSGASATPLGFEEGSIKYTNYAYVSCT